ncbi:hypothetical protein Tco_1112954 [Tanacetum coccineum]|uniref:Uncharacterized protein n=1 Tax=Tanacetum coccineum TaxID=301880 RepID=A0ABQ5IS16_9ASTR
MDDVSTKPSYAYSLTVIELGGLGTYSSLCSLALNLHKKQVLFRTPLLQSLHYSLRKSSRQQTVTYHCIESGVDVRNTDNAKRRTTWLDLLLKSYIDKNENHILRPSTVAKANNTEEKYTTSITKHYATSYYKERIEDMILERSSKEVCRYHFEALNGIHHWEDNRLDLFKAGMSARTEGNVYSDLRIKSVVYVGKDDKRLKGRDRTDNDVKSSNEMSKKIDETLRHREQLRRLKEYVGGRPKNVNPHTFLRPLIVGDLSMEAYFRKIESITTILTSLDSSVNDEDAVHYALQCLPDMYDQVCGISRRLSNTQVNSWRPCFNFAKGMCQSGNGCKFVDDANVKPSTNSSVQTKEDNTNELLNKLLGRLGLNIQSNTSISHANRPKQTLVSPVNLATYYTLAGHVC